MKLRTYWRAPFMGQDIVTNSTEYITSGAILHLGLMVDGCHKPIF